MAALIEQLAPRGRASMSLTLSDWNGLWDLGLGGLLQTTMSQEQEVPDYSFAGFVTGAFLRNSVIFSALSYRARVFADMRFQFQQMFGGTPGRMFGTPELTLIERPEPGKQTRDMLERAILDADLGGNAFLLRETSAIRRLRPDWMTIAYGSRKWPDLGAWAPDAQVIGYGYHPGGLSSGEKAQIFLPEEVGHFVSTPDPLGHNRGVSLIMVLIRDILADNAATTHKLAFYNNAATPNLALKFPAAMSKEKALEWIELFEQANMGATNGWKTLYLGSGVDTTAVGLNFNDQQFTQLQGKIETRIANVTGMHPVVLGFSEGLQGSSLNAGNFASAARIVGDGTLRPLWANMAGSLESITNRPGASTRLWYDERQSSFLRSDVSDQADILQKQGATITGLVQGGFTAQSAIDAVIAGDMSLLVPIPNVQSVQLQPAPQQPSAYRAKTDFWAVDQPYVVMGTIPKGAELPPSSPLVAAFPSLFEPVAEAQANSQIVTREQVVAMRAALVRSGKPAGYASIAKELAISTDTVRRRLREPIATPA